MSNYRVDTDLTGELASASRLKSSGELTVGLNPSDVVKPLRFNADGNLLVASGSAAASVTKFAIIDAATSGDNTIVAAVTGKKIRVHAAYLVASAAVTVRWESGASGTALSGQMQLAANGGFVLPYNSEGWFETAAATLLNLELSGAISVDGGLTYTEV